MLQIVLTNHSEIFPEWKMGNVQFNPFPNKPGILRVCGKSLLKTLWEKEKLLVMSNFSFSHSVFYLFEEFSAILNKTEIVVCTVFQFGRVYDLSFGKGLRFLLNLNNSKFIQ